MPDPDLSAPLNPFRRLIAPLAVLLCLLFFRASATAVVPTVPVNGVQITDPGLCREIRIALNNPVGIVTPEDLATITRLHPTRGQVQRLEGLELCTNLESIDLGPFPLGCGMMTRPDLAYEHPWWSMLVYAIGPNEILDTRPLLSCPKLQTARLGMKVFTRDELIERVNAPS